MLESSAAAIASHIPDGSMVIELGSGYVSYIPLGSPPLPFSCPTRNPLSDAGRLATFAR